MKKRDVFLLILADHSMTPAQPSGIGQAPANIALCKYWGKRNDELNLPVTSSLSVSLGHLGTTTTVSVLPGGTVDEVQLNGAPVPAAHAFARGVTDFLDLFRPTPALFYRVETVNTVPTAAGLASSASGFAALTLALDELGAWNLPLPHLSILARLGSGSASRSVYQGFVEWSAGSSEDGMDSLALPVAGTWPELRLGLVKVSIAEKGLSSRHAMKRTVQTSALYETWPAKVDHDLALVKEAIAMRDFLQLGQTAESNALAMHATGLAAWPPVLFWLPETVAVLHRVWKLREAGLNVFVTMDAGPNVKLLFLDSDTEHIHQHFADVEVVAPFA